MDIRKIDRTKLKEDEFYINQEFADELQIPTNDYVWIEEHNIKSYWVEEKYDTDTEYGTIAYFLNDLFVAYTKQSGRKSDMVWIWSSKEAFKTVRDHVKELMKEEINFEYINLIKE